MTIRSAPVRPPDTDTTNPLLAPTVPTTYIRSPQVRRVSGLLTVSMLLAGVPGAFFAYFVAFEGLTGRMVMTHESMRLLATVAISGAAGIFAAVCRDCTLAHLRSSEAKQQRQLDAHQDRTKAQLADVSQQLGEVKGMLRELLELGNADAAMHALRADADAAVHRRSNGHSLRPVK